MTKCDAGRDRHPLPITGVYMDDLPLPRCEKKATWTLILKPVEDVCEGTSKGIYHSCDYHARALKDLWDKNTIMDGFKTTCPACHVVHDNVRMRYKFRRGV